MKKAALIIFLVLATIASAQEIHIANTASWKNIYSAGIYSSLQGKDFFYLVNARHAEALISELPKEAKVTVIESDRIPYVRKYANRLGNSGINAQTVLIPEDDANLDLAKRLPQVSSYYIVNPTFGYDAISVAPLAAQTHSYVLFATKNNVNEILEFLSSKTLTNLHIIGDVDTEVTSALSHLNPKIINQGNRFKNNVELAEQYRQLVNAKQAILTNGEFLEYDVFSTANQPIIFIGRDKVPEQSLEYLRTAPYQTFVVLGKDLLGSSQSVKSSTQKSVFLKFAKGTTGPNGFQNVRGLDLFPTPVLELLLSIKSAYYNIDQQKVELFIQNEKPARTYLETNILLQEGNTPIATLGGDGFRIDGNTQHTFGYSQNLNSYTNKNVTAQITIPYGESEDTIERVLTTTQQLIFFSEKDLCKLNIQDAEYDTTTQRFKITLKSDKECHAQATILNLTISDEITNPQSETTIVDGKTTLTIKQRMDEVDMADNPTVTISVRYGSAPNALIKETIETLPFKTTNSISKTLLIGIAAIAAIAALIIFIILWKRKKQRRYSY